LNELLLSLAHELAAGLFKLALDIL